MLRPQTGGIEISVISSAASLVMVQNRPGRDERGQTYSEVLSGLVERVTFHNEESGFSVLRVKARGHRELITVIGHAATIGAGEFVQASGRWVNDRTHRVQFRADFLRSARRPRPRASTSTSPPA